MVSVISKIEKDHIIMLLGSMVGAFILYSVIFIILKKLSANKKRFLPGLLQKYIYFPGLTMILAAVAFIGFPLLEHLISKTIYGYVRHGLLVAMIIAAAHLILRAITVLREVLLRHYQTEDKADFSLRKAKTKFQLIQQVLNFLIIIGAVSAILMTFPGIRNIGSTLLASAGVVGLILGFAAQKSLGTIFAGIQIAIAQPIRLDDVVVVEGEFGTIGEISLTYVVLNTWDGRRIMVPINYFLENSFENWTRISPEVVGKVKLNVDFTLPVDEIRDRVYEWLDASELWDKRKRGLLVTAATENTMEIRVTMSTKDSDDAFDLECLIREKLIAYIREKYPEALPQARLSIKNNERT
jgi:small-conductance mechanosensitive channel